MGLLDGKVVLVTGGARGQGRAHAVTSAPHRLGRGRRDGDAVRAGRGRDDPRRDAQAAAR